MAKGFEEATLQFGRQAASGPAAFAEEAERRRFTPTALKAYLALVEKWGLNGAQAAALLAVSTSTWERIKRNAEKAAALNQD
jgi:hypothetical protein